MPGVVLVTGNIARNKRKKFLLVLWLINLSKVGAMIVNLTNSRSPIKNQQHNRLRGKFRTKNSSPAWR